MTPRALRVLGFPVVRERLGALCVSPLGRERAMALEPSPWLDEVARRQRLTTEARALADTLIDSVWGPSGGDRMMLKQLVYRLRRKIEEDPSNPAYLNTITGVGYSFSV